MSVISVEESAGSRHLALWVQDVSEARRRDRFQRDILATTTHDLKGPLGSILLSTELLQDQVAGPPRARDIILRVASAARGAVNLIDEFLSARRIQEGTFILKPLPTAIAALVDPTVDDYLAMAEARKITLTVNHVAPERTAVVDGIGFRRVLGNLLSNALKFTPKGGQVFIRTEPNSEGITLEVGDTGSGMEPDEVQRIFERFTRLDRHRDVAGSGLGLFVVRSLVEAHGGRIEVTSRPHFGTTFRVTFPSKPPINSRGEVIALDFT